MKRIIALNIFLFFLCCCHCVTHGQSNKEKFKILSLGLPDYKKQNATNLVGDKWNIEFCGVALCVFGEDLRDSVQKENDSVFKLLALKYGNDWETLFYNEVEKEYEIELQVDELVKNQSFIKEKEIINPFPGAPFPMYPIDKKGNYIVLISTYNREWEEKKLYKLKVNSKKKSVKIVNNYTNN